MTDTAPAKKTRTRKPESLFIGIFPGGIVYADRNREEHGDYKRIAFLSYDTLVLDVKAPRSGLLEEVKAHAATLQAKAGEHFQISACGHTTLLGENMPTPAPRLF